MNTPTNTTQANIRRETTCGLCDERGHNCRTCKSTLLVVALNDAIYFSESCIARVADEGVQHARQILKGWIFMQDSAVIAGTRRQIMSVLALRLSLVRTMQDLDGAREALCIYLFTGRMRERVDTGYALIPRNEILLRNDILFEHQFEFEFLQSGVEIYTNLRERYLGSDTIGRRMVVAQVNNDFTDTTDTRSRWYNLFLNWVNRRTQQHRVAPRIVPVVLFPQVTVVRREPDVSMSDFECPVCYDVKSHSESVVYECRHCLCVSCYDSYVLSRSGGVLSCALCRVELSFVSREIGK